MSRRRSGSQGEEGLGGGGLVGWRDCCGVVGVVLNEGVCGGGGGSGGPFVVGVWGVDWGGLGGGAGAEDGLV